MFIETTGASRVDRKARGRQYLLPLFVAFMFALAIHPSKAQAQIIGDLEANIPFQFHVGNTKLPAGTYRIHMLDNTDLTLMEISSPDGSISALFEVQDAEVNTTPKKNELIFNKYGDRYFLTKLFDEGNANGSEVLKSKYEKRLGDATAEVARVPAHHRGQQGG